MDESKRRLPSSLDYKSNQLAKAKIVHLDYFTNAARQHSGYLHYKSTKFFVRCELVLLLKVLNVDLEIFETVYGICLIVVLNY